MAFFDADGWPYEHLAAEGVLRLPFQGASGNWLCYAQPREAQAQFVFYSVYPVLVPPSLLPPPCSRYAAGYGLALFMHVAHRFRWHARRGVKMAFGLATLVVVVTGFANAPDVSTASARDLHVVARAMVEDLAGRRMAVTQGLLDDQLLIEARDACLPLALVNSEKSRGVALDEER